MNPPLNFASQITRKYNTQSAKIRCQTKTYRKLDRRIGLVSYGRKVVQWHFACHWHRSELRRKLHVERVLFKLIASITLKNVVLALELGQSLVSPIFPNLPYPSNSDFLVPSLSRSQLPWLSCYTLLAIDNHNDVTYNLHLLLYTIVLPCMEDGDIIN